MRILFLIVLFIIGCSNPFINETKGMNKPRERLTKSVARCDGHDYRYTVVATYNKEYTLILDERFEKQNRVTFPIDKCELLILPLNENELKYQSDDLDFY